MTRLHAGALLVALLGLAGSAKMDEIPSLAAAPPVVVRAVPEAGTDSVDPALKEIRVTYSKKMMDGTWSWSTWGQDSFPQTTGKPHYLADQRTCVLPVKLKANKTYAIWLNSNNFGNFKDTNGNAAVPYLLVFKTRESSAPDQTDHGGN
jgi:RNA polymerase sigma-70 factor (ECF subfamily)